MRTKRFLVLLATPLVTALAFSLAAVPQAAAAPTHVIPAAASQATVLSQWEYASVPLLSHATKQILDTWGADGWELVQVVPNPENTEQLVAYLKREKTA